MHAWWREARDLVRSYGQDKKLFVKTIIPYDHHFPSAETQWYGRHVDPLLIHKYHGFDPALYRDETGMVVERYIPIGADRYNRGRVHNYPWWHVPSLATFYRTREGTAVELYFIYWELSKHPKGFRVGPEGAAGRGFFEPLTFAVRTMNPYAFTFYNWHRATLGRELQLREFARAFRGLPAVAPRPFDGRVKPTPDERLWVRWLGDRLAIVNDRPSPQDIELDIPKPLPAGWRVRELATNTTPVPPSPQARSNTTVALHMRAYDLRVLSFEK